MADPERYATLGRAASRQFVPALAAWCPAGWSDRRKVEVAGMVFATLRGFLVEWRTTGEDAGGPLG